MMKHSMLSASKTDQWTKCPAAIIYLRDNPEFTKPGGDAAMLGTCAHKLMEICINNECKPVDFKNRFIGVNNEEAYMLDESVEQLPGIYFIVDDDMIESVTCVINYLDRRIKELGLYRTDIYVERKVNPLPERSDTYGTADIILDGWPYMIEVIDYKHGKQVFVEVKNNLQLKSYSLGALCHRNGEIDMDYDKIVYTICQPRHAESPDDGVSSEHVPISNMIEYKDWLNGKAERVDEAHELTLEEFYDNKNMNSLYTGNFVYSGESASHCCYCPLDIICPSLYKKMENASMNELKGVKPLDFKLLQEIDIDDESAHLAEILPWLPKMTKWIESVKKRAREIMIDGEEIEGYKIVAGRSNRKWVDQPIDYIVSEMREKYNIPEKSLMKLISGPQAEKLVSKNMRKDFNDNFLFKPMGGPTVAKQSDRRVEIMGNAKDDFSRIE